MWVSAFRHKQNDITYWEIFIESGNKKLWAVFLPLIVSRS